MAAELIHDVVTAGMVFRDPPWSVGGQQNRGGWGDSSPSLAFEVFPSQPCTDVTQGRAPLRGSCSGVTKPQRKAAV